MNTYRIRYEQRAVEKVLIADRTASSPISALNQFHREMQVLKGIPAADYSIIEMAIRYNSDPSGNSRGEWIESVFQLPLSKTPVLVTPKQKIPETEAMPFLAGSEGQGRLAE